MERKSKSEVYEPFLLLKHSTSKKREMEDTSMGLIRRVSSIKPGSVQSSFCSLFSSTVGIGFLSIPYATAECGLLLGAVVLILAGVCFGLYYKALAQASDRTGIYSYVGIVENLYGQRWSFIAEVVIITSCLGLLSVMWVITLELSSSLFPFFTTPVSKAALLFAICLLLEFPLSIKPEIASLRYASAFSFLCVAFLAITLCVDAARSDLHMRDLQLFNLNLKTIDSIILVLFAYDATVFIPIIFSEMAYSRRRSYSQMRQVIKHTNTILVVFYLVLGIAGYLALFPNVPELFVVRSEVEGDLLIHIAKYLVLITVLIEIPLIVNPARLTIQQLIGGPAFVHSPSVYYTSTVALLLLPICMALNFRKELTYFKVLGSICSVCHGFIMPSSCYAAMVYYKVHRSKWKSWGLCLLTLVLSVFGLICVAVMWAEG